MIIEVISYILQVITYITVRLEDLVIYNNLQLGAFTWRDLLIYIMCMLILINIVGGMVRHNGNS